MSEKRKISVRKVLQLLLTAVVATCCVIAIVSAARIEGSQPLKELPVVHISNDRKYHFIEQQEIMNLAIYNRKVDILGTPISKIDLRGIEKAIMVDPWVADAQVYIGIDGIMHMYVTQRVPVARLFGENGNSYYMDSSLNIMPLSDNYTYYSMVVTNVPDIADDSARQVMKAKIAYMVRTIRRDTFWNAQISHIIVDSIGSFELIPVVGNQRIKFGDTSRAREKFDNLMVFYRNVLNRIGWDKYEELDARFKGQVVASPSLPFKMDDPAFKRMSWVASVRAAQEQNRSKDSAQAASRAAAQFAAERLTTAAQQQLAASKKNRKKKGKKDEKEVPRKVLKGREALDQVHNSLKSNQGKSNSRKAVKTARKAERKAAKAAAKTTPAKHHADAAKKPVAKGATPAKKAASQQTVKDKGSAKKDNKEKNSNSKGAKYTYPAKK